MIPITTIYLFWQPNKLNEPPFTLQEGIILFWRTVRNFAKGFAQYLPYILVGTVVFIFFWLLGKALRKLLNKIARRNAHVDPMLANLVSRLAATLTTIFGFLAACVVIFPSFKPGDIIAGLGITSVAIGFAFKDILQNFFAGLLILWRRPFKVGDQIKVKDFEGTVEEINMRSTRLTTYDGERVILPNGDVFTSSVLVRTAYPARRIKVGFSINSSDSLEEIRELIYEVLDKTEGVLENPGPLVYVSDLTTSSLNIAIYFWVESQQANALKVSDRAITGIRQALNKAEPVSASA